jgi:CheY-like chemotaxis protein
MNMDQAAAHSVLIIDPSPESGKLMALILTRHGKGRARVATSVAAAWPLLAEQAPALVFIYLRDEGLNLQAVSFCHRLRSTPGLQQVPVLVYGAVARKDIAPTLQEAGAMGYLCVPLVPSEVMAARDAALRGETCFD